MTKFDMTNLGLMKFFLGLEVRKKKRVFLYQKRF